MCTFIKFCMCDGNDMIEEGINPKDFGEKGQGRIMDKNGNNIINVHFEYDKDQTVE